MRSAKRVIAATALGLPILFGAPGMAFAGEYGGEGCGHGCHSKGGDEQDIDQSQDASTAQGNFNKPTQHTFNVGSGEANSVSKNHQKNDADTDQTEWALQED